MRRRLIISALLALLQTAYSHAQEQFIPVFDVVRNSSAWLSSPNRAGLYALPLNSLVDAHVDAIKTDGGFKDVGESANAVEGGVGAEAYAKVGERICFYGNMGYSYFLGQKMGGPVLMDPSYNAINFYEYPNDNLGQKTKETYRLEGGMSYRVTERFSLGFGAGYRSGNCSKRKDPRNLNRWMDFDLSLGVMERFSDRLSLGADLRYRRTLESVTSRTYGVTGENYFYFIDYGASLGKVEVLGSDNFFISSSSERPMENNIFGAALQLETVSGDGSFTFFGELGYDRRSGSYGEKASSEILFTRNYGNEYSLKSMMHLRKEVEHRFRIEVTASDMQNYINSFDVVSNPGENLEVEYFGEILTRDQKRLDACLGYELLFGGNRVRPDWRIKAEADYGRERLKAYYYPYMRSQSMDIFHLSAGAVRSVSVGRNVFEAGAAASFGMGKGIKAADGQLVEVSGPGPRTADEYLNAGWEFLTAPAASAEVSFRYLRSLRRNVSIYVGVNEKFGSLLQKPEYLDSPFRNAATLSVGCIF